MPTYVYKFVETGETIEVQQAFTDEALTEAAHPGTGAVMAVKKVFTPVGVTFRGNGFYKTDNRSKSKRSSKSSSGDEGGGSTGGSTGGSDSGTSSTKSESSSSDSSSKSTTSSTSSAD